MSDCYHSLLARAGIGVQQSTYLPHEDEVPVQEVGRLVEAVFLTERQRLLVRRPQVLRHKPTLTTQTRPAVTLATEG